MQLLFPVKDLSKFQIQLQQFGNKHICSCTNDTFIFGGNETFGITTVRCYDCNNEYQFKHVQLLQNKAPLEYKPIRQYSLRQDITFQTGPSIFIKNQLYYYPISKLLSAYGEDYCQIIDRELSFSY